MTFIKFHLSLHHQLIKSGAQRYIGRKNKMTNLETNLTGTWSLFQHKAGSYCSIAMWNSFFMPQTKAQAKKWLGYVSEWETSQPLLSQGQVDEVASFMLEYSIEANFRHTKSKSMVRLVNFQDFINCVKKKFAIK